MSVVCRLSQVSSFQLLLLVLLFLTMAGVQAEGLDPAWIKLLHAHRKFAENWRSDVAGGQFFLSRTGWRDPEAEWWADRNELEAPAPREARRDFRCRFPARFVYFQRRFPGRFSQRICPELSSWKQNLAAKSVTIVHAAQYSSNPASLFGHVFIRFDTNTPSANEPPMDVLAHSVGYFAKIPEGTNSLAYAYNGLTGGFPGEFLFGTYARSLREYNQMEDRDLWEFHLKLTQAEIDQLLNHLWELVQSAEFRYHFLLENCAYQLLASLEAAVPQWDLTGQNQLYLVPGEAVAKLQTVGAVDQIHYRPSLGTQLRARVAHLNSEQRQQVRALRRSSQPPVPPVVETVDVALDWVNYSIEALKGDPKGIWRPRQAQLLDLRASFPAQAADAAFVGDLSEPPTAGHRPAKLKMSANRFSSSRSALGLEWRPGLFALTEGPGFPSGQSLEVLDVKALVVAGGEGLRLDQVNLLRIENLRPFESVDRAFSWRMEMGVYRPLLPGGDFPNLSFYVDPAVGLTSVPIVFGLTQVYVLATLPLESQNSELGANNAGLGLVAGVLWRLGQLPRLRTEWGWDDFFAGVHVQRRTWRWEASFPLAKDWQIQGDFQAQNSVQRIAAGLAYFY